MPPRTLAVFRKSQHKVFIKAVCLRNGLWRPGIAFPKKQGVLFLQDLDGSLMMCFAPNAWHRYKNKTWETVWSKVLFGLNCIFSFLPLPFFLCFFCQIRTQAETVICQTSMFSCLFQNRSPEKREREIHHANGLSFFLSLRPNDYRIQNGRKAVFVNEVAICWLLQNLDSFCPLWKCTRFILVRLILSIWCSTLCRKFFQLISSAVLRSLTKVQLGLKNRFKFALKAVNHVSYRNKAVSLWNKNSGVLAILWLCALPQDVCYRLVMKLCFLLHAECKQQRSRGNQTLDLLVNSERATTNDKETTIANPLWAFSGSQLSGQSGIRQCYLAGAWNM